MAFIIMPSQTISESQSMGDAATLYIVDEASLLSDPLPTGNDLERFHGLVNAVQSKGAHWAEVDCPTLELARILESIDTLIGGTRFLPVLAFNNSPQNLLGNDGDCPFFGYFAPDQVKSLSAVLQNIPPSAMQLHINQDPNVKRVYQDFLWSAMEASSRGSALAILHT